MREGLWAQPGSAGQPDAPSPIPLRRQLSHEAVLTPNPPVSLGGKDLPPVQPELDGSCLWCCFSESVSWHVCVSALTSDWRGHGVVCLSATPTVSVPGVCTGPGEESAAAAHAPAGGSSAGAWPRWPLPEPGAGRERPGQLLWATCLYKGHLRTALLPCRAPAQGSAVSLLLCHLLPL